MSYTVFENRVSVFLKPRYCCQTVLPDRSTLKRPKLVESAKIEKGQIRHFEIIFKHCGVVQANGFQVLFLQISSKSLNPLSGGGGSSTSWCSSWLPCYHDKRSLSILFFYALKVPPPHTPLQKIWWKPWKQDWKWISVLTASFKWQKMTKMT